MKIIIAGAGDVGNYLAKMLYRGQQNIIIIDIDKKKLEHIDSHFDYLTVEGSATSIEVLKNADIKRADLFIALTEIEEVNITSAILAKRLGAKKVIARVDKKEYLLEENKKYITDLGIDQLIYPEILAAREISNILSQTGAVKTFKFANGKLSLFVIKLDKDAPVIGMSLVDVVRQNREFDFRAVAILRAGKTIIPTGEDIFVANDMCYVICNENGVETLMKYSGKKEFHVKRMMIMGASRVGLKTALTCEKSASVKILEINEDKCYNLTEKLSNTLVINGDGRDHELLHEEGIENMDAFVAVTGSSETNILACWHAKKLGVPKTIAEIENMDYLDIAEKMGIDSVINKKLIAASHIYSHVMTAEVSSVYCLISSDAEILEYTVSHNARITRKTLKDIKFPPNSIIGGIVRKDETIIAKGDTQILENDVVVVFALPESINKITKLFR